MWIYTHYTMTLRNHLTEEISGEYRAVLELATAMHTELEIEDIDPSVLREKQLKERIDKEIRGGAISYAYPGSTLKFHSIRKSLKSWFQREKWWFLVMLSTTILCSTTWMIFFQMRDPGGVWFWIWLYVVWFGEFWAFCIGTTAASRLLIILFWGLVGGIAIGIPAVLVR